MQAVAGRAGLIAEMHAVKLCSYPLDDAAHAGIRCINLTPKADLSLPAGFSDSDRVLQFGDIDSYESFSIICHGSSSCDEDRLGLSEQPSEDQCRASHLRHEDGHTVLHVAGGWAKDDQEYGVELPIAACAGSASTGLPVAYGCPTGRHLGPYWRWLPRFLRLLDPTGMSRGGTDRD